MATSSKIIIVNNFYYPTPKRFVAPMRKQLFNNKFKDIDIWKPTSKHKKKSGQNSSFSPKLKNDKSNKSRFKKTVSKSDSTVDLAWSLCDILKFIVFVVISIFIIFKTS